MIKCLAAIALTLAACRTPQPASAVRDVETTDQVIARLTAQCDQLDAQPTPVKEAIEALFTPFAARGTTECGDLAAKVVAAPALTMEISAPADFHVLRGFANLRSLQIVGAGSFLPDMDVTPALGALPELTKLLLFNVPIVSLDGLETLTKLQTFAVQGGKLANLAPLARAVDMRNLTAIDVGLEDVSAIKDMLQLRKLVLRSNKLTDVTPVMFTAQVEELDLSLNPTLANVSAVQFLASVEKLHLSECAITNLDPLANLAFLTDLVLNGNRIVDLSPLATLPVKNLSIIHNAVTDLTPLTTMPALEKVLANHNPVATLPTFPAQHTLKLINIMNTAITDPCGLHPVTGLVEVRIGEGPLSRAGMQAKYGCVP